jgi:hypothetical protein
VEAYREGDRSRAGEALEARYAQLLRQMPPGGKAELSAEGILRLDLAGEMKGKLEMERLQDGTWQVTVRGGMGLGLAASTGGAGAGEQKVGAEGSMMLGGKGGVTLHFRTVEEAADRLAALTQTGVLQATNFPEWVARGAGLVDGDAAARSALALKNLQGFEVGLYGELQGELEADLLKAGGKALEEGTLRVDVAEGKLVYECSVQAQLQAGLKGLEAAWKEGLVAELGTNRAAAGLETRTTFRVEVAVTKEELARVREGKLRPQQLLAPERLRKTVTQEVKGELGGVSISARRELPLEALKDTLRAWDPRGEWEVSAARVASSELELDAAVVGLKAGVLEERPLFEKGPRKMRLGEVEGAVRQARAQVEGSEQRLLALRAMAR